MKSIVVSGVIANKHLSGGAIWTRLNWTLGFRELGFDVYFVEEIEAASCVDADGQPAEFRASANTAVFARVMRQFGLETKSALLLRGSEEGIGLTRAELARVAVDAEALINISGHLSDPQLLPRFRRKAFIDLDPGFTQIWEATGLPNMRLRDHDYHFTIGENIGKPNCIIPDVGCNWRATRQPNVLRLWKVQRPPAMIGFTSIGRWRGPYGALDYAGQRFGLKAHEWRKFVELPQRVSQPFEIALDIDQADQRDIDALVSHGWNLVDPTVVSRDPDAVQGYLGASGAEFSAAQGVYVGTNSGWVSDRTVCYLASGRPALVQETGFSENHLAGAGLLPFRTLDEAIAGAEEIVRNYRDHCTAARELAERDFDSDPVLSELIDQIDVQP